MTRFFLFHAALPFGDRLDEVQLLEVMPPLMLDSFGLAPTWHYNVCGVKPLKEGGKAFLIRRSDLIQQNDGEILYSVQWEHETQNYLLTNVATREELRLSERAAKRAGVSLEAYIFR